MNKTLLALLAAAMSLSAGSAMALRTPAGSLKAIPAPPIPSGRFCVTYSKPATPGFAPAT